LQKNFEGAAMIRTKGEAGTGNVVEAVKHIRLINRSISELKLMDDSDIMSIAENFALAYRRLLDSIRKEQGINKSSKKDVVFEEYTFEEISEEIYKILLEIKEIQRLPVVNFAAGGVATPADAAFMMQLGMDGVFVGSGIFKSSNPPEYAKAIVEAVQHYDDPSVIAEVSKGLGDAMKGLDVFKLDESERMETRGV
jgi:pyridoxal 5'-phosphate synthase pdxS subunit